MPDIHLPHIAAQAIGTPLLMHPRKLDNILSWLGPRLASGTDWSAVIQAEQIEHRESADYTVADGVAIVPVMGSLVHRGSRMGYSGTTAYQALDKNLTLAMNDHGVHSVLLDIDSPGGQVAGVFDLCERILQMRSTKRIVAVASDLAASAAYALGCAAHELVVTQTASAGSIGVVTAHVDYSQKLAEQGVGVTYIYAGDHKVDGNPYEPLPDTVKADLQAEIDGIYQLFTGHVAKARGLSQQQVIDTQARVFIGEHAVSAGLADRVGTLDTEFERLKAQHRRGAVSRRFANRHQRNSSMTTTTHTTPSTAAPDAAAGNEANTPPAASTEQTAVLELTQAEVDAGQCNAASQAEQAERARVLGIIDGADTLGMSASVTRKMIENGSSLEAATDMMLAVKENLDEAAAVNTSHAAGATAGHPNAMPSYGDIYSKRNQVNQGAQ